MQNCDNSLCLPPHCQTCRRPESQTGAYLLKAFNLTKRMSLARFRHYFLFLRESLFNLVVGCRSL